jgi:hypothetical protein
VDQLLLMGARIQDSTYFGTSFVNPRAIPELVKRDFTFNLSYGAGVNFFSLAERFGHLDALKHFIKYGRKNTPEADFINTLSDALVSAAGKGHETIVKSRSNSQYTVIQNSVTFNDITNVWNKARKN